MYSSASVITCKKYTLYIAYMAHLGFRCCWSTVLHFTLGLYSLSGRTSYCKISWSIEAVIFRVKLIQSLCNLTGTSAAAPARCLSNFRAIRSLEHPISRLRVFTRVFGNASYRLVNRGPASHISLQTFTNTEPLPWTQLYLKSQHLVLHTGADVYSYGCWTWIDL